MDSNEEQQLERLKADLQKEIKGYEAQLAAQNIRYSEVLVREREAWLQLPRTQLLMFRAVIDFALLTIRSLILVNGGAIIGILSFAGNLWGRDVKGARSIAEAIGPAISWFVAGLAFAVLTGGLSYLSQAFFVETVRPWGKRWGNIIRGVGLLTATLSLIAFAEGSYASLAVFGGPAPVVEPTSASPQWPFDGMPL